MVAAAAYPAFRTIVSERPTHKYAWTHDDREYLLRYALLRVNDRHAAEDAVQDTLLAALQSEQQFRGRSATRTWLVGILKHKIADHYRRSRRQLQLHSDSGRGNDGETGPSDAGDWSYSETRHDTNAPDRECERKEVWQAVERGLAQLPSRTAEAFRRGVIECGNSKDVCKQLAISPSNYWVMLHRARKHLQGHLVVCGLSI